MASRRSPGSNPTAEEKEVLYSRVISRLIPNDTLSYNLSIRFEFYSGFQSEIFLIL